MRVPRVSLTQLWKESNLVGHPVLRYLKMLVDASTRFGNENYYASNSKGVIVIEGNYLVICSYIASAHKLFLHKSMSWDVMWIEASKPNDKSMFSRLWINMKPSNGDNFLTIKSSVILNKELKSY